MKKEKLGNICKIIMGQSPPSDTYNFEGKGLPFFQGKAEFTELHPVEVKWCSKPKKTAIANDILLSVRAPVGTTNIANQECCIGRGLAAIRYPENYKFIFYFLRSIEKELDKKGTGTTFKAISGETLKNVDVPFPKLEIQNKIVEKIEELFSELDNGVEELKKVREQLKVYRQSVLSAAFSGKLTNKNLKNGELPKGWKKQSIKELCEINPRLPFQEIKDDLIVTFLPMKRVEEVSGKIDLSEKRKYSEVKKGYTPFTNNDIIFAKITPCMENGKIAIVSSLENKIGFGSTEFHVFRCKDEVINKYLFYFLVQEKFRNEAKYNMAGAVGQKRVPKLFLENSIVPIPDISEQQKIVNEIETRLSVCDKMEETIDTSLAQSESLRQSILKQAFEGKLIN